LKAAAVGVAAPYAFAQAPKIENTQLGDNLFLLSGAGGNVIARTGPEVVMVDGGLAQNAGALAQAVAALPNSGPVRTLFNDVRHFFPIGDQLRVYRVCERHMMLATEFVDTQLKTGTTFDGSPVCCHASTRRGTPCARVPLPGSKYCPSHKHLDEELEVAAA